MTIALWRKGMFRFALVTLMFGLSGCSLIVRFDRTRIREDAAVDARINDSGSSQDSGVSDASPDVSADASRVDSSTVDGAADATVDSATSDAAQEAGSDAVVDSGLGNG